MMRGKGKCVKGGKNKTKKFTCGVVGVFFFLAKAYLWAAVFASTTPAVCIQERTEFSPPSGSSFIVVPPRGIVS